MSHPIDIDHAIDDCVIAFYAKFKPDVITLAEIVVQASGGPFLTQVDRPVGATGEDDTQHAAMFRRMVASFAAANDIDAVTLAEAVECYRTIEVRAQAMCGMAKAIHDLDDTERLYRAMQSPEWRLANAWGSMPIGESVS